MQVRRECCGPGQAEHEVHKDRERVYGQQEEARPAQAVGGRPVFMLMRERVVVIGCIV